MKKTDKERAKRLLKFREEGPRAKWHYLLKSKRLWLSVVVILLLVALASVEPVSLMLNRVVYCLLGILIGRVLRDLVWLQDIVDGFSFSRKVIDWTKVEALAQNDDPV